MLFLIILLWSPDTISLSLVRRCPEFGHNGGYIAYSSPKMPRVRTQRRIYRLLQSEDAQSSDTTEDISLTPVRRCPEFGHNGGYIAYSSPKMPRVRTHPKIFRLLLSEDSQSSDTTEDISLTPVRRFPEFGHNGGYIAYSSPKMLRLRTRPRILRILQCEDAQSSDTSEDISLTSVRRFNSLF